VTAITLQSIAHNTLYKNYVAPVCDKQLGWEAYANKMSIDTCTTAPMRRGWLAANRAEAYAQVMVSE